MTADSAEKNASRENNSVVSLEATPYISPIATDNNGVSHVLRPRRHPRHPRRRSRARDVHEEGRHGPDDALHALAGPAPARRGQGDGHAEGSGQPDRRLRPRRSGVEGFLLRQDGGDPADRLTCQGKNAPLWRIFFV